MTYSAIILQILFLYTHATLSAPTLQLSQQLVYYADKSDNTKKTSKERNFLTITSPPHVDGKKVSRFYFYHNLGKCGPI